MAKAIGIMMHDEAKYREFSSNARRAVKEKFDLDVLLEETYKKYF